MKFLADENMPRVVVEWIRALGCDVLFATELNPGETDTAWAVFANQDQRIVLT